MRIKEEQNKENGGDKDDLDEEKTEKKEEEEEEDGGDKDDLDEEKVERNEEKVDKNEEEEEDGGDQHTAELVVNTKPWEEATTAQTMMIIQNISNTVPLNAAKTTFH